jgi:cytochrome c oxidase cbb3-type subunit IV
MYRQFYAGMDLTDLPLFALLFFLAVFLGVVAWLFVARRSRDFEALSRLPLSEPSAPGQAAGGTRHE